MKYCTNCGAAMQDDQHYCSVCGKPAGEQHNTQNNFEQSNAQNNYEQNNAGYNYVQNVQPAPQKKSLVHAILALVFGIAGLYFSLLAWIPIAGIICGILGIGLSIAGRVQGNTSRTTNPGSKMASAGRGLSLAGLIVGIVFFIIGILLTFGIFGFMSQPYYI